MLYLSEGQRYKYLFMILNELRKNYQLDFVTPGILPITASSLKTTREIPNFLM